MIRSDLRRVAEWTAFSLPRRSYPDLVQVQHEAHLLHCSRVELDTASMTHVQQESRRGLDVHPSELQYGGSPGLGFNASIIPASLEEPRSPSKGSLWPLEDYLALASKSQLLSRGSGLRLGFLSENPNHLRRLHRPKSREMPVKR